MSYHSIFFFLSLNYCHLFLHPTSSFQVSYALGWKFSLKELFLKTLKHIYVLVKIISPKIISSGSRNKRWWTHSIFQVSHKEFWFLLGVWRERPDYGGPGLHKKYEIGQDGSCQSSPFNFHKNSASTLDRPRVLPVLGYSATGNAGWRGLGETEYGVCGLITEYTYLSTDDVPTKTFKFLRLLQ